MPWKVVAAGNRCPAHKPFAIILESTGKVVACHESEEHARKQLRALYANEGK